MADRMSQSAFWVSILLHYRGLQYFGDFGDNICSHLLLSGKDEQDCELVPKL